MKKILIVFSICFSGLSISFAFCQENKAILEKINQTNSMNFVDTNHVNLVIIKISLDSSINREETFNLKENSISIPFHCTPVFFGKDSIVYLTYPTLYKNGLNTIVWVLYQNDNFNFSNGGDDANAFLLRVHDKFQMPKTLIKNENLYQFDLFSLPKNQTKYFKYIVQNRLITERHEISTFLNMQFVKYNADRECD